MEIVRSTYDRGGLLAFFSGNDAGVWRHSCSLSAGQLAVLLSSFLIQIARPEIRRLFHALLSGLIVCIASVITLQIRCKYSSPLLVMSADVLRTMPSKAIELASFDMYKKTLGRLRPGGSSSHPGGLATGFAGALAGAHTHCMPLCLYPASLRIITLPCCCAG